MWIVKMDDGTRFEFDNLWALYNFVNLNNKNIAIISKSY